MVGAERRERVHQRHARLPPDLERGVGAWNARSILESRGGHDRGRQFWVRCGSWLSLRDVCAVRGAAGAALPVNPANCVCAAARQRSSHRARAQRLELTRLSVEAIRLLVQRVAVDDRRRRRRSAATLASRPLGACRRECRRDQRRSDRDSETRVAPRCRHRGAVEQLVCRSVAPARGTTRIAVRGRDDGDAAARSGLTAFGDCADGMR